MVTSHHECFQCGEQNRTSAQFCRRCGRPLANQPAAGHSAELTSTITSIGAPSSPPESGWPAETPSRPPEPPLPPPAYRRHHGWWPIPLVLAVVLGAAALAGWQTHWPTAVFGIRTAAHDRAAPGGASSRGPAVAQSSRVASPDGSSNEPDQGSSSPETGGSAEQQAASNLAGLLSQSVSDRSSVNDAYNDVLQCGPDLDQDAQVFQTAASARQQLLSQLASLPSRSALSPSMLQDLNDAWQESAQVDGDYVQWAQDESSDGCSDSNTDANYVSAEDPNTQATADKTAFTDEWNQLASQYGLTQYQQGQL